jgi:hypothetical protein
MNQRGPAVTKETKISRRDAKAQRKERIKNPREIYRFARVSVQRAQGRHIDLDVAPRPSEPLRLCVFASLREILASLFRSIALLEFLEPLPHC